MNKQEAIEKINESRLAFAAILSRRNGKRSYFEKEVVVMKEKDLVDIINQIDEQKKPVIPQFVADWIEVCKEHLTTSLYSAMNPNFMKENSQSFDLILWIKKTSNQGIFARAWLDGYEVEKKKTYTARLKLVTLDSDAYLNKDCTADELFISGLDTRGGDYQIHFKQTELEELGIWNNPAFEIEEVE